VSTSPHRRPVILAMVRDPIARQEIAAAGPMIVCSSVDSLTQHLDAVSVRVVVHEAGAFPSAVVQTTLTTLAHRCLDVPVIVCWQSGKQALEEVSSFLHLLPCVTAAHTALSLRSEVLTAMTGRMSLTSSTVLRRLGWTLNDGHRHRYIVAALAISGARRSVLELAATVGISRRSMSRHCRSKGIPRPVTLLGWARGIHIVHDLDRGGESLKAIALKTGERSARDCADYVRYHTGAAPTTWLDRGGVEAMTNAFANALTRTASLHHNTLSMPPAINKMAEKPVHLDPF
jgi:hypothetical protein